MAVQQGSMPHRNGRAKTATITDQYGDHVVLVSGLVGRGIITVASRTNDLERDNLATLPTGADVSAEDLRALADILDAGDLL